MSVDQIWIRLASVDQIWIRLAWVLPRRLAYWCAIRVAAHAGHTLRNAELPAITITDMLARWDSEQEEAK